MQRNPCVSIGIFSGLIILCSSYWMPVWAVSPLITLNPPSRLSFTGFATSLAIVGDVDADSMPDYLVGAYQHGSNNTEKQGRAFLFSGREGRLLLTLDNPFPQADAAFGCAVAGAGDVNQDGVPDLIIGAFGQGEKGSARDLVGWQELLGVGGARNLSQDAGSGQGFVFSGKDGQLLYALLPPQPQAGAAFGWSVTSMADVTQDGINELVVGAPAQDGGGRVFVFNGRSGSLLRTLMPPPESSGMAFGWAVAAISDLNTDGAPEILVGAPHSNEGEQATKQGRVYVFSGQTGTLLYSIDDPQPQAGATFGWHVASGGDLNQDEVPDILVGAPHKDVNSRRWEGAAFAFSGQDGSLLFALNNPAPRPDTGFGWVVGKSMDLNQDGAAEIFVGAPYQRVDELHVQGEVFVFNGRDGRHLTTLDNPSPHQGSAFGYAVASPGDVDGDRLPDFVIGAAGQGTRDRAAVGRVYLFLSQPAL